MVEIIVVADDTYGWPEDNDIPAACQAADLILTLGDLIASDVEKLTGHGTPIAGVYGNHCSRGYLSKLGVTDLSGGTVAVVGDTPFGTILGVSGCVRYKDGTRDVLFTQDEYREALDGLPAADWVVSHCPPLGCNDHPDPAHVGIAALTDYIQKHRPAHLFHGHTYPDPPVAGFYGTAVHYVHGWESITV